MNIGQEIERLIDIAIREDIGHGDISAEVCISDGVRARGVLVIKQSGMVAGLPYLAMIFQKVDPLISVELHVSEGSCHKAGTPIATVEGPARGILSAERTVLNFLQHASGVATLTANYVRKVAGYECAILDTRATLPGLRALEKYAIQVGGGTIHRYSLSDRFIIKKNYRAFATQPHPIVDAVRAAEASHPDVPIEVEISRYEELEEALQPSVSAVMLENMSPTQIRRCVKKIHTFGKKVYIQCTTDISLDAIREYAETGVDGISIGSLSYHADPIHISMRLVTNREESVKIPKQSSAAALTAKRL